MTEVEARAVADWLADGYTPEQVEKLLAIIRDGDLWNGCRADK